MSLRIGPGTPLPELAEGESYACQRAA